MSFPVLYLGSRCSGWLCEDQTLRSPCQRTEVTSRGSKLDYLKRCQQSGHPEWSGSSIGRRCVLLVDNCVENIAINPSITMSGNDSEEQVAPSGPLSIGFRQHRFDATTASNSKLSAQSSFSHRLRLDKPAPDSLGVTARLSFRLDSRISADSRFQTVRRMVGGKRRLHHRFIDYPNQADTLEWCELLKTEFGMSVTVLSYSLVVEAILKPLTKTINEMLVITVNPDGSERHWFFKQGWLVVARLVPGCAGFELEEQQATLRYIGEHVGSSQELPVFRLSVDTSGESPLRCDDFLLTGVDVTDSQSESQSKSDVKQAQGRDPQMTTQLAKLRFPTVARALRQCQSKVRQEYTPGFYKTSEKQLRQAVLRTAEMQQLSVETARLNRARGIGAACSVGALCLSGVAFTESAFLLKKKYALEQVLVLDQKRASQFLDADQQMDYPVRSMQRLLEFRKALQEQSYHFPVAVLTRLEDILSAYPGVVLGEISWENQFSSEPYSAILANRPTSEAGSDVFSDEFKGLQLTLSGFVHKQSRNTKTTDISQVAVEQLLSEFEQFLADLQAGFAVAEFASVTYPFGSDPNTRRRVNAKAETQRSDDRASTAGRSTTKTSSSMGSMANRFSVSYVVDQQVLVELFSAIATLGKTPRSPVTHRRVTLETSGMDV